jgi:alpha-methylacyl-CoA racemase
VLEIGGMGPAPFAGMMLADMGADVLRVDRPGGPGVFPGPAQADLLNRNKRSAVLDLKTSEGRDTLLALISRTAVLIEGYRPGVAERLGFGPGDCWDRNPALVYGRMTGWGQDGPAAHTAGHDITYIAATGALHAIGPADGPPSVPLNLLGDYGGGGIYLVAGVLAALREAERTGRGQVVDAAITDAVAHLLAGTHALLNVGAWTDEREANLFDGGAPYYGVYATSDGRYVAVGAVESKFYAQVLAVLGLPDELPRQQDRSAWPASRRSIAAAFARQPLAHWVDAFAGTDACVGPVLTLAEAAGDAHLAARRTIRQDDGALQPAPAPRFSAHPDIPLDEPPALGAHTATALADWDIPSLPSLP